MSVIATTWHAGAKRAFGEQSENDDIHDAGAAKARRLKTNFAASGWRQQLAERQAYSVGPSAVAALRALFPAMNDQVISEVLQDCGTDIDAAIRRLGELQLSTDGAAARREPSGSAGLSPVRAQSPGSGKATASPGQHGATSSQRSPAAAAACDAHAAPSSDPSAAASMSQPAPPGPSTPDEWIEAFVASMAAARDVADARQRAARLLHAFQQTVMAAAAGQVNDAAARQQLADLQRDNGILKRAVAIQNTRLQEGAARDAELQALRGQLKQAAERVSTLELSNYSLAQHLRAATSAQHDFGGPRHPDVC